MDAAAWNASVEHLVQYVCHGVRTCRIIVLQGAAEWNLRRLLSDGRIQTSLNKLVPEVAEVWYKFGEGVDKQPHVMVLYTLFRQRPLDIVVNRFIGPSLELLMRSFNLGQDGNMSHEGESHARSGQTAGQSQWKDSAHDHPIPKSERRTLTIRMVVDLNDPEDCKRLFDKMSRDAPFNNVIDRCLRDAGLPSTDILERRSLAMNKLLASSHRCLDLFTRTAVKPSTTFTPL